MSNTTKFVIVLGAILLAAVSKVQINRVEHLQEDADEIAKLKKSVASLSAELDVVKVERDTLRNQPKPPDNSGVIRGLQESLAAETKRADDAEHKLAAALAVPQVVSKVEPPPVQVHQPVQPAVQPTYYYPARRGLFWRRR